LAGLGRFAEAQVAAARVEDLERGGVFDNGHPSDGAGETTGSDEDAEREEEDSGEPEVGEGLEEGV
jgi:hypothetical protein